MNRSNPIQGGNGSPPQDIRVVLVEDDPRQREAIASLIASDPRLELVGQYPNAESAVEAVPGLVPDVALIDLDLPGVGGSDLIRRLKPGMPGCQFLVLTVFASPKEIFGALRAGATGYLLKSEPADRICQAIVDISLGEAPMSGAIARRVLASFEREPGSKSVNYRLSPREFEILEMLAQGLLYKEIATATETGLGTVRTHIRRIYEKLHVHNRTEAVRRLPQASQRVRASTAIKGRSRGRKTPVTTAKHGETRLSGSDTADTG